MNGWTRWITGLIAMGTLVGSLVEGELQSTAQAKPLDDQFMVLMAARNATKAKRYETAIDRYRKLLKMNSAHPEARVELGWVLLKVDKFSEGQQEFEKVLRKDPNNVNALRGRLEGARKRRDGKAEYEVLDRLVRLSPDDRSLRKQLALALHNQGKFAEAEKHLAILMGEQ